MYANSTALAVYTTSANFYYSSLTELISITCLCTLLISMIVSIAKNPRIRRMQTFMKYLYFFAAITNLTQLYGTKRHNSKQNASTNLNGKIWHPYNYITHSYAMYSLFKTPLKYELGGKYVDDAIDEISHLEHKTLTPDISEQQKRNNKKYNNFSCGTSYNYWSVGENIITPKYKDLRDELLNNNIYKITTKEYETVHNECLELHRRKGHKIKAKNVGTLNQKYKIPAGSTITTTHLIALKVYTDYSDLQKRFKMYHRSGNSDVGKCEIYYFFKYLNESCTLFGDKLKKQKLYCGIKEKLIFSSLTNRFNCALSTTTQIGVAQNFAGDNGMVLALKTSDKNARYFNLSWMSHYHYEKERLIMGSTLKICDIFMNGESAKKSVSAIRLMEQLCKGKIKKVKYETNEILYDLIVAMFNGNDMFNDEQGLYLCALFSNVLKTLSNGGECDCQQWRDQLHKISNEKLKLLLSEKGYVFSYIFGTK